MSQFHPKAMLEKTSSDFSSTTWKIVLFTPTAHTQSSSQLVKRAVLWNFLTYLVARKQCFPFPQGQTPLQINMQCCTIVINYIVSCAQTVTHQRMWNSSDFRYKDNWMVTVHLTYIYIHDCIPINGLIPHQVGAFPSEFIPFIAH